MAEHTDRLSLTLLLDGGDRDPNTIDVGTRSEWSPGAADDKKWVVFRLRWWGEKAKIMDEYRNMDTGKDVPVVLSTDLGTESFDAKTVNMSVSADDVPGQGVEYEISTELYAPSKLNDDETRSRILDILPEDVL